MARLVVYGFGRMPADPPGGNGWACVYSSIEAHEAYAEPEERISLGWVADLADLTEKLKKWAESRGFEHARYQRAGQHSGK